MFNILIVDDTEDHRLIVSRFLIREGYGVRTVGNAEEAEQAAQEFAPDLLITDWLLAEGKNGRHVAEALRRLYPALKVLFFTGLPIRNLEIETQHLESCRFLEKTDFTLLTKTVRDILSAS